MLPTETAESTRTMPAAPVAQHAPDGEGSHLQREPASLHPSFTIPRTWAHPVAAACERWRPD
jgi:hypothetical protein